MLPEDFDHEPGRHEAIPEVIVATQEANPVRTMNRTGVQAFAGAAVALLVLVPEILRAVLESAGEQLPPQVYAWLTGALALATVISVAIARVMAIPGVNEWLRKYVRFLAPGSREIDQ